MSLSPKGDCGGIGGLALLSTIGAKTGKRRHTPLGFARDGDCVVVLASNAARAKHPGWYFNLKRNSHVTITIPEAGRAEYIAHEVEEGPERERLWRLLLNMNPGFAKYPARTGGRVMPVIHCKPAPTPCLASSRIA